MRPERYVAERPEKPVLLYDGDCGFCRYWVLRWRAVTRDRIRYDSYQDAGREFPDIPVEETQNAVQLVESDGRWTSGAEAVFRVLASHPLTRWPLWMYQTIPGVAALTETVYHLVAINRMTFSRLTRLLWGKEIKPSTYQGTRWLFLRALTLVYLIGFLSLLPQITGLIGEHGILPARMLMNYVHNQLHGPWWMVPSLAWWRVDDAFLRFLCWGGAGLSLVALFGFLQPLVFFLLWLFYLSIVSVGGDFLSFQWDALLLEAGFLAIFFAPMVVWENPKRSPPASGAVLFLLRWLLFRLMLQSAIVKWISGDPTWHHFTALQVYYETMPLPNALSWFMHNLPAWFHKLSVGFLFLIEGLVPFAIFLPRRGRLFAFFGLAGLQIFILATGNYGIFNFLTLALCLLLLDDEALRQVVPQNDVWPSDVLSNAVLWGRVVLVSAVLAVSGAKFLAMFKPEPFARLFVRAEPFRSVNNYGLFAVMTTTRPEIVIEGSNDGKMWLAYEFKYKIQDDLRRPRQVAPYMPRLDWQMWFAALGDVRQNPWFMNFALRLLQGSPDVMGLMRTNPFPDHPPKMLRAQLYQYHFTTWKERRETGAWWKRELLGLYLPAISLS